MSSRDRSRRPAGGRGRAAFGWWAAAGIAVVVAPVVAPTASAAPPPVLVSPPPVSAAPGSVPATAPALPDGLEGAGRQHAPAPEYQGELPAVLYIVDARPPEEVFRDGFTPQGPPGDLLGHAWLPSGVPAGPFRDVPSGFIRAAGTEQGRDVLLGQQWLRRPWVYRVAPGPDFHHLRQSLRAVADNAWARVAEATCRGDMEARMIWTDYAEMAEEWLRRQGHVAGRLDEWVGTDVITPDRIQDARPVQWDDARQAEGLGPVVPNTPAPGRPGANPELMNVPAGRELFTGLPDQEQSRITGRGSQLPVVGGPPDIEAPRGGHLP